MKLVYLESPFAGDVDKNIRYARACMADSLRRGEYPLASHLLYTQEGILDDTRPSERTLGMEAGFAWAKKAKLSAFYIDLGMSQGMKDGLARAISENRTTEIRQLGKGWDK